MQKVIVKYWLLIIGAFAICMFAKPVLCGFILGSTIFCIYIEAIIVQNRIKKRGIESVGQIIEYVRGNGGRQTPVIEYKTLHQEIFQGKPYVYSSTDLNIIRSYKSMIGKEVLLKYDPEKPENFIITGEESFNILVLIIFVLAGLFFCMGSLAVLFNLIKVSGLDS